MRSADLLRRLTIAALLLLSLAALPLAAQTQPETRLREVESALLKGEQQQREIRRRAETAAREAEATRNDMVAAARAVQGHEDSLSELEAQLADLAGIERDKAQALDRKRQQLNAVLTALQRLAFRPSEALIAQPTSPADTVRSAILLKDVVPRIEIQVASLRADIDSLAAVKLDIARQQSLIKTATAKLDQEHRRLASLFAKKQLVQLQTEDERQAAERRLNQLASEAADLRDLMIRLEIDKQRRESEVAERAAAEKLAREAEAAAEKAAREAQAQALKAQREAELAAARAAKEKREAEQAAMKQAKEAELQAKAALKLAEEKAEAAARAASQAAARTALDQRQAQQRANRPFSRAQGEMPFPARGKIIARFGQGNDEQTLSKGIVIETRGDAQVVSPYDGQVVFAGPFRGYGLLLIIEHGEGYHTLLAGMARIDGTVGQHLALGEPVGIMGQAESKPQLYVEFRHNGQPVNPLPWLTARKTKVSG